MHLRKLTLRHFRNVGFAALEFSGRQQFLLGANGQGKTNLLEAAGFITALRSFRTTDNKLLIGHGQTCGAVACEVEHEKQGDTKLTIKLRHDGKEVWADQERVTKMADYLGRFPTVVFSSQDMQLVRGTPALRRRWLDLTLSAMDATYFRALQTYTRALAERNALLKMGRADEKQLGAFEQTLAPAAVELIAKRHEGLKALGATMQGAYAHLCDEAEPAGVAYQPHVEAATAEEILARLEAGRARDQQFRITLAGPHRDDFAFSVRKTAAKDFASEGQQRSLVLALRLAQAVWFREQSGVRPVLLADDVLGELDPQRRERFWSAIDPESQVIATGTHLPSLGERGSAGASEGARGGAGDNAGAWQVFEVADGVVTERPAAGTGAAP